MDSRKFISSTTAKTTEAIRFLRGDIWRIREKDLPRRKSILLRSLRVLILSVRGISSERAGLRASALTFYSLLSVVPVPAMVFGIAKGFGFESALEGLLMTCCRITLDMEAGLPSGPLRIYFVGLEDLQRWQNKIF